MAQICATFLTLYEVWWSPKGLGWSGGSVMTTPAPPPRDPSLKDIYISDANGIDNYLIRSIAISKHREVISPGFFF